MICAKNGRFSIDSGGDDVPWKNDQNLKGSFVHQWYKHCELLVTDWKSNAVNDCNLIKY
jgi:hypothetical protein